MNTFILYVIAPALLFGLLYRLGKMILGIQTDAEQMTAILGAVAGAFVGWLLIFINHNYLHILLSLDMFGSLFHLIAITIVIVVSAGLALAAGRIIHSYRKQGAYFGAAFVFGFSFLGIVHIVFAFLAVTAFRVWMIEGFLIGVGLDYLLNRSNKNTVS